MRRHQEGHFKWARRFVPCLAAAFLVFPSCAAITGTASFTLLSRNRQAEERMYEPIGGRVREKDCFHSYLLIFASGNGNPNHEAVVAKILEEASADVLLQAELRTTMLGFPYVFMRICAEAEGQPARVVRKATP